MGVIIQSKSATMNLMKPGIRLIRMRNADFVIVAKIFMQPWSRVLSRFENI